jgi:hypothetical protein
MATRRLRPLLWTILFGFVGCFVAVAGYKQGVEAAIGDGTTQHGFISHPSMAAESVRKGHHAIEIDNRCALVETGNFIRSYGPMLSYFIVSTSGPQFRRGSLGREFCDIGERNSERIFNNVGISIFVSESVSWSQPAIFNPYKCFRPCNTIKSFDPYFVNRYIGASLGYIGAELPSGGFPRNLPSLSRTDRSPRQRSWCQRWPFASQSIDL